MKYAEVAKLKHDPGCTWSKGDDFCDCGAIEKSLAARVAELEAEVKSWRERFPTMEYRRQDDLVTLKCRAKKG